MLFGLALALAALLVVQPAAAQVINTGIANHDVVSQSTATGGSVGPINNTAVSVTGPSTSISDATAKSKASSDALSLQGQKQQQGNDQNISSTVTVPAQAPAIFAPNLTSSPEACMGSVSAGGGAGFGGTSFGITFGTTWTNDQCQDRMNARTLALIAGNAAAQEYLAEANPKMAAAMKKAGVKLASLDVTVPALTLNTPLGQAPAAVAAPKIEKHDEALPTGVVALGPVCGDGKPSVLRSGSHLYSCYGWDRDGLVRSQ
jgi:hypothetical protein